MKAHTLLFAVLVSFIPHASPEHAISDDGREVELKADGSWQYLSDDRFATLPDGRRIRLHADGSWSAVDDIDAERYGFSQKAGFSRDVVDVNDELRAEITDFYVEKARDNRHKNSTVDSRMVITLMITGASTSDINDQPGLFLLSDSRGRTYVTQQVTSVEGTNGLSLTLVVEGSPRWWGVRYFSLELQPGAIGNDSPVTLTRIKGEVTEKKVQQLEPVMQ